jgi:hypothetical protein
VVNFETEKKEGKLLALILFFLHLTVQMRLDRLDGVGKVVWADAYCLEGVITGFLEGLSSGAPKDREDLPAESDVLGLLRSFSGDEWKELMNEFLKTYSLSREELALIREHSDAHLDSVQQALATLG